ncbi:YbaB/EbfC family nucleoid-associated protein [Candidatus Peregrinibacteria bacterium]|nr:MAG: YbaB/EbfC family nucleoid-associated protein [Candidatus Peregrinibacteria bacterium]
MGLFDQAKDLYKLQKQAKQLKAELKTIHVEAEHEGLKVTVDGEQTVISTEIQDPTLLQNQDKLQKAFTEATNKAIKKSQMVGAEKMKSMMGDLGGLMGGQ